MKKFQQWQLVICFAALACACTDEEKEGTKGTIHVRGIFDLSGPTKDVGIAYFLGVQHFISHVNANGGIRGYQVDMQWRDYAYDAEEAVAQYQEWQSADDWSDVVTIFGWGTGDSMALKDIVAADKRPYVSASYAGSLADPRQAPYNFFGGTDYSTSIRLAMKFIAEREGAGQKIAFAHCSAGYCKEPIPAGKQYAESLGLVVAPDILPCEAGGSDNKCPELSDDEATIAAKMAEYIAANPDVTWIWLGNTITTATYTILGALDANSNIKFISNTWGFDESIAARCGDACVGTLYGIVPFAFFGDTIASGMTTLLDIHREWLPKTAADATLPDAVREATAENVHYVQGHVSFLLWKAAIEKLAKEKKDITGEAIKKALETFSPLNTGQITAPIHFSADDHRPNSQVRIYAVNADGRLRFDTEVSIDLEDAWLGW